MRWLIIIWLLLLATTHLYFPAKSFSNSRKTLAIFADVNDAFSEEEYSGEKAQVYGQLKESVSRLDSMLFATSVRLSYGIIVILGLMAIVSGFMLILRKEIGVKLGLITLTLMLLWGIHTSFSKEIYRERIKSEIQTIYRSVNVLSEKKLEFSPQFERATKPKLAQSLSFQGLALIFLTLLFLQRRNIIRNKDNKTIQQSATANSYRRR